MICTPESSHIKFVSRLMVFPQTHNIVTELHYYYCAILFNSSHSFCSHMLTIIYPIVQFVIQIQYNSTNVDISTFLCRKKHTNTQLHITKCIRQMSQTSLGWECVVIGKAIFVRSSSQGVVRLLQRLAGGDPIVSLLIITLFHLKRLIQLIIYAEKKMIGEHIHLVMTRMGRPPLCTKIILHVAPPWR